MTQARYLYTVYLDAGNQRRTKTRQSKRLSKQSSLTTDAGDVQEAGTSPGQRPVSGAIKGEYAQLMTKQLEELAQNQNYGAVAYFTNDDNPLNDAYVTVESFSVNPVDPKTPDIWEFDGKISEKGSRRSQFRAVELQRVSIDNPFDDGSDPLVATPLQALTRRWYDQTSQEKENASNFPPDGNTTGRTGGRSLYDPTDSGLSNPTLVYDLPYDDAGRIDARVWDDFGRAQFDDNGVNSWQKVFATGHNFRGNPRVENGRVRLTLNESDGVLRVEQWNDTNEQYEQVSLNTSDWVLDQYSFTRIAPCRVEGQIEFVNQNSEDLYSLNFQVNRASDRVLFTIPKNNGAIPSGLQTKLTPVAETWTADLQPIRTILSRSEVND